MCGTGEKGGRGTRKKQEKDGWIVECVLKNSGARGVSSSWRRFPSWWNRQESWRKWRRVSLSFPPPPSSPPNVSNSDEMRLNIPPPNSKRKKLYDTSRNQPEIVASIRLVSVVIDIHVRPRSYSIIKLCECLQNEIPLFSFNFLWEWNSQFLFLL